MLLLLKPSDALDVVANVVFGSDKHTGEESDKHTYLASEEEQGVDSCSGYPVDTW